MIDVPGIGARIMSMPQPLFSSTPLEPWFQSVYRPLKPRMSSPASVESHLGTISKFAAYLREKFGQPRANVEDLVDYKIGGFMLWMVETGRAPTTANKHRRNLMALAGLACKRKLIDEVPDIDRMAEYQREPECWSIDEMANILVVAAQQKGMIGEAPASIWWPAIIWTAFNTGYRIGALMSIRSCDVRLDEARLNVRPEHQKDKADQPVFLLAETVEALRLLNYRHLERVFEDWPYDRGARQWKTLTKRLRGILATAGLPTSSKDLWHKFRRVFATYITAASDIETARQLCGHSHARITMRYVDRQKVKSPQARDLLPRPNVARQLKLFQPPPPGDVG